MYKVYQHPLRSPTSHGRHDPSLVQNPPKAETLTSHTDPMTTYSIYDAQFKEKNINLKRRRAFEGLERAIAYKKRLLNTYYKDVQDRIDQECQTMKERVKNHVITNLERRKQEINKLMEVSYSVQGVCENGGKLTVKIKRAYHCRDEEKMMEILKKETEIPPLAEPIQPKPQRKRKQQAKNEHETRVEDIAVTVQWGLTADEIREDLRKIFPNRKFGRIVETHGFLNAPSRTHMRTKRKHWR